MKWFGCLIGMLLYGCCFGQDLDSIVVLPVKMAVPDGARKIGTLKVGNNSTKMHCDYGNVILEAKRKARDMGGNLVKITKLQPPAFISSCYKVVADVYHVDVMPDYPRKKAVTPEPQNQQFATLYIYRLADTMVPTPHYKLHLDNDSVIATVKSKWKDTIPIYKEGPLTLWAKAEKRAQLKLNIKFGQNYYIRCGVVNDNLWMTPVLESVDKTLGASEYEHLRKGKKEMDVDYLRQIH